MNIGFDIRPFLSGETGVGVYFRNLLHAMSEFERDDTFCLFSSSLRERFPAENLPGFKNRVFRDLKIPVSVLNFLWFRMSFPPLDLFFRKKLDLTHSPNPLITPGGKKKIITIHDLSFLDDPVNSSPEAAAYFRSGIKKSAEKADAIISVSEFTKSRIGYYLGKEAEEKTTVIYHGSDMRETPEKTPSLELPENYFLYIGTLEPRKNLGTLIRAFATLRTRLKGYQLVLAGKEGPDSEGITQLISELKLQDEVRITGYLHRGEIRYALNRAAALIFPSRYEGFGLPVLEAASAGIPAIVSDLSVFHELFSDYPLFIDQDSPDGFADAMFRTASEDKIRRLKKDQASVISGNFSWKKSAAETLAVYDRIAG